MEIIKPQQSALIEKYQKEYSRTRNLRNNNIAAQAEPKPTITPVDLSEYVEECEIIGKDEFPELNENDIENGLQRSTIDSFPRGKLFCLAVIPFIEPRLQKDKLIKTDAGKLEWADFINSQGFLKALTVYPEYNNITVGMNETSGYYFDILPKELQKDISEGGTTFKLDYPPNTDPRTWLAEQYLKAYENLKRLLNK